MVLPRRLLSTLAAAALLRLTSAADDGDLLDAANYLGSSCAATTDITFNATGSVSLPGLQLDDNAQSWTWHSGLGVEEGALKQYFWLDTTGSDDLYAVDRPYNLSLTWFTQLNSIPYDDAVDDTGDCEAALGKECVEALYAAVRGPPSGSWCCSERFIPQIPEVCGRFKADSGPHTGMTWGWNPRPRNSTTMDGRNKTCSTLNNSQGRNSRFASQEVHSNQSDIQDTFDIMAKRTHVFFASTYNSSSRGGTNYKELWVCLKNTDFAEGSRDPSIGGRIVTPTAAVMVSSIMAGLLLLG